MINKKIVDVVDRVTLNRNEDVEDEIFYIETIKATNTNFSIVELVLVVVEVVVVVVIILQMIKIMI